MLEYLFENDYRDKLMPDNIAAEDAISSLPADQHVVVVAGPGCGKSWRIGERVAILGARDGLTGDNVAVVSLTRSTVRDLQRSLTGAQVGTLHSFALTHLNKIGDAPRRRIVDQWEERNLVVPDLKLLSLPETRLRARDVRAFLAQARCGVP
jgi:superfamily I DNA/RNA helicase